MKEKEYLALERKSKVENTKKFQRSHETTQVLYPKPGRKELVKTRLTHVYEVLTSAQIMAYHNSSKLGFNVDYQYSLNVVCLDHDIGHTPFGHSGSYLLNKIIKLKGLKEGFDDNNNNLTVLEKNGSFDFITDYEVASLIKYPNKLYPDQKEKYLPILETAIQNDVKYFKKNGFKVKKAPKNTVSCAIMDEADRNSYVSSDLSDCFCLGISNSEPILKLYESKIFNDITVREILTNLISSIDTKESTIIKNSFNRLKSLFNKNYIFNDSLKLVPINKEIHLLREELYKIEKEIYINSDFALKQREKHVKWFKLYIDYVFDNEFYPSKTYKNKILQSKTKEEKLRNIRDMIAETTDWYIFNSIKKLNLVKDVKELDKYSFLN